MAFFDFVTCILYYFYKENIFEDANMLRRKRAVPVHKLLCVRIFFIQVSTTLRLISLTSAPVPDLSKSMPPFNVIINDLSESLKKAPRHAFYYVMTKSFNCKDDDGVITHFAAIRKFQSIENAARLLSLLAYFTYILYELICYE